MCIRDRGSLKHRTLLTAAYAAGLRVSEATHLKVTDIDSQRMMLRVAQGKEQKDRYVMLSPRLLETLRLYWKAEHPRLWLFPGDLPGQPITRGAVTLACQKAHRASGMRTGNASLCLCGALLAVANLARRQTRSDSNPIAPPPARAVQYNRIFSLPFAVVALHLQLTSARRARQAKNPLHYVEVYTAAICGR